MKKKLSKEQESFLCLQYLQGKTMPYLASEWELSIGTVFNIIRRHPIKQTKKLKVKSEKYENGKN